LTFAKIATVGYILILQNLGHVNVAVVETKKLTFISTVIAKKIKHSSRCEVKK